jgi:serine/threonine-protein kinase
VDPSLPSTIISLGGDEETPRIPPPLESGPGVPSLQALGRYRILALVGSGGMGNVYRALDTELDEVVALKMLRQELSKHEEVVERFRREVKLARRVTHRNIARVYDIGESDGEKFLTMELIDGPSLAERLADRRALPLAEALELALVICQGLQAAHTAGVVHLDLKPGNVLLERGGRVVITDFGIARALAEARLGEAVLGTPGYMAPEQMTGGIDVDARADLHALGALLHEMATGRPPFAGDLFRAAAISRLRSPPPDPRTENPSLPQALTTIVQRAMALRPDDRYPSVGEMEAALTALAHQIAEDPSASIPPPSAAPMESSRRAVRKNEKAVAVLPFRNTGAPGDAYLAEELTDDLIDALSMTAGLRVAARSVVAGVLASQAGGDPRDLGRTLRVQVVAEGAVRRAGGRVRVSARLISVEDGFQLWAKRFDRPEEEVLAVNDEVARSIASALTVEVQRPTRALPQGAGAVDLYVRARNRYRRFWPEAVSEAIALFEEAEALSPGDPSILAGLSLARTRMSYFEGASIPAAIEAGRRAIAASSAQGEPHLALGMALLNAGAAVEAVVELRLAVALSPGLAEGHAALGRLLVEAGAVDEGMKRLRAATELDPEAPLALGALVRAHAFAGEWARALELAERSRATDGHLGYLLSRARIAMWRHDAHGLAALAGTARAFGIHGELPEALLGLARAGADAAAPIVAPELGHLEAFVGVSPRCLAFLWQTQAEACAFSGETERALDALERASGYSFFDRTWLDRCPLLDGLRGEPRFLAVAAEVGQRSAAVLAAYARR